MTEAFADAQGSTTWFTSFGLRIGVRSKDPGVLEYVTARRPAPWRPTGPGRVDRLYSFSDDDDEPGHVVCVGALTIARGQTLDQVMGDVELDARHYVAEFARRRVFVHAGAVGIAGRMMVIPGRSGTGKSTLVAALVRRGATYYSDEYAVFDHGGRIHPYPKALALRADDGSAVEPIELGTSTKVRHPPLSLGAVLSTSFAGADTAWQPRSESAGSAMMALLDNAVAVRRRPKKTLSYLQRAVLRPLCWPLAAVLYAAFVVPGAIGQRLNIPRLASIPLATYRGHRLRSLWLDTFDRMSAPLEARFTPAEAEAMFVQCGLSVSVLRADPGLAGIVVLAEKRPN